MTAILASVSLTLLLWTFSWLYFRSYLRRRTSQEQILAELRDEIDKLISEVDAATDRDVILVEDRIQAFRSIMDEAERRIRLYQEELTKRSHERAYAEFGQRVSRLASSSTPPKPAEPSSKHDYPVTDQPAATDREAAENIPKPFTPGQLDQADDETPAAASLPRFSLAKTPIKPKAPSFMERVSELHRAGFSGELIAKRLGAAIGEVELAIALDSSRTDESDPEL